MRYFVHCLKYKYRALNKATYFDFKRCLFLEGSWRFEYPKHVSFGCNRCSRCCGDTEYEVRHILLLKNDAERISKETLLDINNFSEEVTGSEPYIYEMRKMEKGKCFFLKNNLCTIYKIRPLICRFYPFQLRNIGNNNYSFSYTDRCSGIGKKPKLNETFFENLFHQFIDAMERAYVT